MTQPSRLSLAVTHLSRRQLISCRHHVSPIQLIGWSGSGSGSKRLSTKLYTGICLLDLIKQGLEIEYGFGSKWR
ncbi:hypothetical protein L6452_30761 [Arctium lappa]|uniref:Uncharacterized protein n=1 Tax=Arctium lappa TaxID=4217 RepID=A0ACB8ZK27_ARCLA|nr:hypothetical protein L6452_30761 [Arctium lappa]